MSDEKKLENRFKLSKRRNSLPEIVIRKPKLIQVKSLDIPINFVSTSNALPSSYSQFKTNVPKILPISTGGNDHRTINNDIIDQESTFNFKKSLTTTSYDGYEFEKLPTNTNTRTDLFESSNNSSVSNFYCKKCRMKQDFGSLMESNNLILSSADGEYEKVMPIVIPELKIVDKKEFKIQNIFSVNSNFKKEIYNLKFVENNSDYENKSDFKGVDQKDLNRKNNQPDKILRIQDYDDNISSASYEPVESKRTPNAVEEKSTDLDVDVYVSNVLTNSLKDLPEGGGNEMIQKCKSQFMKPIFRKDKDKLENDHSSNLNPINFDLNDVQKDSIGDKTIEETHLYLNANLLKQLNVDFVLLNFGSIYPPVQNDDSVKIEPITRNLSKTQRADSLEVQTSSTRESSCSASDESSNNGCPLYDMKPVTSIQSTLHPSRNKNDEEEIYENPEGARTKIQCSEIKDSKKSSKKVSREKNTEKKYENTQQYVKINKQKYEKKMKTSSIYASCDRICPGRMETHRSHSKNVGIHSTKNFKSKYSSASRAEKSIKTISSGAVKKMTVFQTQSDIITPDIENGPKRFYQKTEINDGEKCIEILEIVECGEPSHYSSSEKLLKPIEICDKGSSKPLSIQDPKKIKSLPEQKSASVTIPKTKRTDSNFNLLKNSSPISKVYTKDEMTQTLPSPYSFNCIVCRHQEKIPKSLVNNSLSVAKSPVNQTSIRRRNTPSRSGDSLKYHHIFEVIPEEKSSSISTDSSSEEQKNLKRIPKDEKKSINDEQPENTDNRVTTIDLVRKIPSSSNGNQDSDPYPSTDKTQTERSNQCTITSPSIVTANAGSLTPKNTSSTTFPTSSESCDLMNSTVIKQSELVASDTTTSSTTPVTVSSCIKKIDGQHQKQTEDFQIQEQNENLSNNQIAKDQNSLFNTKTDYVWRVDGAFSDDNRNKCKSATMMLDVSPGNTTPSTSMTTFESFSSTCTKSTGPESICSKCCFCNPILHDSSIYTDTSSCPYCNRKKTPKLKVAETNTECNPFCLNNVCSIPYHCCTSTSSDRTMTKCTQTDFTAKSQIRNSKKIHNKKDKKTDKHKNPMSKQYPKNLSHSQDKITVDVSDKCPFKKTVMKPQNNIEIKLPETTCLDSCSECDSSSTSLSVSSELMDKAEYLNSKTCCKNRSSSSKFRRKYNQRTEKSNKQDSKDVAVQKTPPIMGANNDNNYTRIESNGRSELGTKSSGWSVTVTGSCQELIPDVEMKLKFPQKSLSQTQLMNGTDKNLKCVSNDDKNIKNDNSNINENLALPSTKKPSSNRCTSEDTSRSQSSSKLPDLSFSSRQQLIPSNNIQDKNSDKINSSETNFPGVKNSRIPRTMSYQIISTQSGIMRHGRNEHGTNYLEFNDITTHHHHHHHHHQQQRQQQQQNDSDRKFTNNCLKLAKKPLAVTGNAIEPEQKPRVQTMSEKDLTRKHRRDSNFTRNRSFYV